MTGNLYRCVWPLLARMPAEWAHALALRALRTPLPLGPRAPQDPFEWRGLRFRNRVGIACGFDKNATCLRGLSDLGAGFVEVGTVLTRPWSGAPIRPRMKRLIERRAVWNRLGFPSDGLARIAPRLERFAPERRRGMLVACNIGPHPLTVRAAGESGELDAIRDELIQLVRVLAAPADLFVLNLSSPNTPGLRGLLHGTGFARDLVAPLRAETGATPLLVKLPPEDAEGRPWSRDVLARLIEPLVAAELVDGFVAVNTSTALARALVAEATAEYPGGISGDPLRALAVEALALLRALVPAELLLIGVGGVVEPAHARELVAAGADLVELYTGMIYRGPGFVAECALALQGFTRSADRGPASPS